MRVLLCVACGTEPCDKCPGLRHVGASNVADTFVAGKRERGMGLSETRSPQGRIHDCNRSRYTALLSKDRASSPPESSMPINAVRLISASILMLVAARATSADALFRSGFETSICNQYTFAQEPNDTVLTADLVALDSSRSAIVCGSLNVGDDVDYFQISVASSSTAVIETLLADGVACGGSMMSLTLYNASLTPIATVAGAGTAGCASLDGLNSPALQNLAPGNYYIQVLQTTFDPAGTPPYALDIRLF
jgi:hypothetical protein